MRRALLLLILIIAGCAGGGTSSKYSRLIDAPFVTAEVRATPATTSFAARGDVGVPGAGAHGELSVEVPGALVAAFFGVPLEGASDLVFLLDRSGSMLGKKLDQAKSELSRALDAMPDGTRFNIVFFGDRVTPLSSGPLTLGPTARAQAKDFLRRIQVEDRTAMVPALWYAEHVGAKRVVLLSDGEANVEGGPDEMLAAGRRMIRSGVRFDVVVLMKRQEILGGGYVTCADRHPSPGMSVSTQGIEEACRAEAAAEKVRTLATESGGSFRDPLAP